MRATIWGTRGSLATPGPDTLRYGGNTSCVELRLGDGSVVVLDAGTGIRPLGRRLADEGVRKIHLLLTHLHLDHLEGLAFFLPLWDPAAEIEVWGPSSPTVGLEERVARYFSPPLFPIHLSDVPCRLTFHDVRRDEWWVGSAAVTGEPVEHPGPTLGYRLEEDGRSLVYIPDHEPYVGGGAEALPPEWVSGFSLAEGADVLLHDAQYFESEYPNRVGWGHSSVAHAVAFARNAGVGRLVLFHHDPMHTDGDLGVLAARAAELWGSSGTPPELAFEAMEIALPPADAVAEAGR